MLFLFGNSKIQLLLLWTKFGLVAVKIKLSCCLLFFFFIFPNDQLTDMIRFHTGISPICSFASDQRPRTFYNLYFYFCQMIKYFIVLKN